MADPNMELIRQLREAMEEEGFTPTTDNGWIGTLIDVSTLAREHARLTDAAKEARRMAHVLYASGITNRDLLDRKHRAIYEVLDEAVSAEAGDTDG
jgi:hypothetical protein